MFRSIEKDVEAVVGMQQAIMHASKYAAQHHYGKEINNDSETGVKSYNVLRTSSRARDLGARVVTLVEKNAGQLPPHERSPYFDRFMHETYSQLSTRRRKKLARVALFGDGRRMQGIKNASRGRVFVHDRGVDPALVVQLRPGEQPEDIFFANLMQELQNDQAPTVHDESQSPAVDNPRDKAISTKPLTTQTPPTSEPRPTPPTPFEHHVVRSVQQAIDMAMHEKSQKGEFEITRRSKKALAKAVLRRLVEFSSDQNISTIKPAVREVCATIDNLADLQPRRLRTKRGKRELIEQAIDGIPREQGSLAEVRPLTIATLGAVVLRITHNGYNRRYSLRAQPVRRPRPAGAQVPAKEITQERNADGSFAPSVLVGV